MKTQMTSIAYPTTRGIEEQSRNIRNAGLSDEAQTGDAVRTDGDPSEIKARHVRMPGNVEEGKWNEAKDQAHKSYPELNEDQDKFWKIVQAIYDNMGGKRLSEGEVEQPSASEPKKKTPAEMNEDPKKLLEDTAVDQDVVNDMGAVAPIDALS